MKLSLLSKAIGAAVISFNLAMLASVLPVAAQTNATPSSSNTGSSTHGDATTGTSNNASPNTVTNTAPGASPSDTNTTSGNSNTSNSTAPASGSSTSGTNPTASQGETATTASPNNTPARGQKSPNWAWFGLLGLIGAAGLLRRPQRTATVGLSSQEQLRTNVNTTGVRLNQGLSQAGTEAHNLLEDLQTKVSTFQERRTQEKEIKQIKNALGRPSKRVILDRQDNVILNIGDLITNEAVERARAADMLDVLLNSVDESDPEIKNEERIAPVPGEASLEEHNR